MLKMLNHPLDKIILLEMLDQSFRSNNHQRVGEQIAFLLDKYGIPPSSHQRKNFGSTLSEVRKISYPTIHPFIEKKLRQETRLVIIPGEGKPLKAHLKARKKQGVQMILTI